MDNVYYAVKLIALLWLLLLAILLIFGQPTENERKSKDKSTYFIAITLSPFLPIIQYLTGDFEYSTTTQYFLGFPYLNYVGFLVIALGLVVHASGMWTLKSEWTVYINIKEESELIQRGVFKFIRHPIYCGLIIELIGFCIVLSNWISFFVILLPNLMSILYRMKTEENALIKRYGNVYLEYMATTKRFIPFIL
ncbi:methyltransferase family protein [Vibrio algarum]|uniref:Isoprenylcysteine carboxylmethyltransferase family protein n=1 Tax=Vibrio algarum TaxID=3020714 RepID=A0ABT4YU28_9VIBR|nr:isoprenylcysteine carboxylmethyltransferase family protein [Vibrio sp. KJ40-1]MDB1125082.1 isoprenylcysteine carboxylmethyltransferase family protein [Vibrio sp. KJ40-1]